MDRILLIQKGKKMQIDWDVAKHNIRCEVRKARLKEILIKSLDVVSGRE